MSEENSSIDSKHTPGPWTADRSGDGRKDRFIRSGRILEGATGGVAVCRVCNALPHSENEANMTLIASAPELLQKLKGAQVWLELAVEEMRGKGIEPGFKYAEVIAEIEATVNRATR